MSKTLHGTTSISLDGVEYELVPTLAAVRNLEARFGGLRGVGRVLEELSVDGCAAIVAAGANLSGKAAEAIADQVWQEGVLEVSIKLSKYLSALYNPRGASAKETPAAE